MNARIRSKIDHLTVADRTLMRGEVGDCPLDRAKYLARRGEVEIVGDDAESTPDVQARAEAHDAHAEKVPRLKGDVAERAVDPAKARAEHQTKKG